MAGRASVGEEYAGQPFTSTDMAKEGLLYKQGSWFKVNSHDLDRDPSLGPNMITLAPSHACA